MRARGRSCSPHPAERAGAPPAFCGVFAFGIDSEFVFESDLGKIGVDYGLAHTTEQFGRIKIMLTRDLTDAVDKFRIGAFIFDEDMVLREAGHQEARAVQ